MTALELYEIVVGEGGIEPTYFLQQMVWWEAQAFVNGLRRRQRSSWEQTRWLARLILSGIGGKKKDGSALTDEDIQIFPWEDKQPTQEELDQEEEDRKYLEAQCIEYNRAASK